MNPVKLSGRVVPTSPKFKQLEEINALAKASGSGLANVYGFVEPNFRFIQDHVKDWKPVSAPPNHRQFVGANLTLEVRPQMFLPSGLPPAVVSIVRKHEDEHMADAREIVTRRLPARLRSDAAFSHYFIERKPIAEGTYKQMLPTRMTDILEATFIEMWNAACAKRDTPANYKPVKEAVEAAMRKLHP